MVANESELQTPLYRGRTKEYFWRKVLARFADSGLTQVEFCKRENLNLSKFSWWKREIGLRNAESKRTDDSAGKHITEGYWRKVLAKYNRSGLSKDDFCKREGIKPAAFVWWRGEIGRRDQAKSAAIARPLAQTPKLFVPFDTPAPLADGSDTKHLHPIAEIDLQQRTVRIFENATPNSLAALFRALKEFEQ
jgi:hypothetical protein